MNVLEFVQGLKPSEASVAIGLLELVRRADEQGRLERGEWLAAVRAAYQRAIGFEEAEQGTMGGPGAPAEFGRYLEEHILARLAAQGLVRGEPQGQSWERVRLEPRVIEGLSLTRAECVSELERAVRNLLEEGQRRAHHEAAPARPVPQGSTVSARGLVKTYRRRRVVADVALQVSQGEIVGLLGPNGAGKTTTFYMIVGLIGPDEGQVFLDDQELTRVPMYQRARAGIGYLAQEPSIFRKLTVEQNILAILETMPLSRAERRQRLERL